MNTQKDIDKAPEPFRAELAALKTKGVLGNPKIKALFFDAGKGRTGETQMIDYQNAPICVIACDPGKSGAVVRLGQGHLDVRRDFKELPAIAKAIRELSGGVTHAVMEAVHAMPGQGVCSMFSFGRAAGAADGAFALSLPESVELAYVTPQKWQNLFREMFNWPQPAEFNSREMALAALPQAAPFLARVLDHNTADALLMAVWRISNPEMESPRPTKARGQRKRKKTPVT